MNKSIFSIQLDNALTITLIHILKIITLLSFIPLLLIEVSNIMTMVFILISALLVIITIKLDNYETELTESYE